MLLLYFSLHKFWFWLFCAQILEVVVCLHEQCVQSEREKPRFTSRTALVQLGGQAVAQSKAIGLPPPVIRAVVTGRVRS